MSLWRRTAIEQVPGFRRIIEASGSPTTMWIRLSDELEREYRRASPNRDLIVQMYNLGLWCSRNAEKKHRYLCENIDLFFERVLGSPDEVVEDISNHITVADFRRYEEFFSEWFSEEQAAGIRRAFYSGKHKQ